MTHPRPPSLFSRLVKSILLSIYRAKGWTITGERPTARQFVITGAPHSSNWDFVYFLGATHQLGISPSFMGKTSLFRWPLKRFMFDMGGVPVDRSARGNYVEAMAAAFAQAKAAGRELALVIAPDGSRSSKPGWRSGFYHIALAAGVPIVPAWVDYARKTGGLGPALMPTGDYAADLARIAAFYRAMMPGNAQIAAIETPKEPAS